MALMMRLGIIRQRDCQGLRRRDFLQVGGAGLLGLTLADAFRADAAPRPGRRPPAAKACILIYLAGGPSQFETFDPKPNAPAGIRSPWGAVPTQVPGVRFSELVPMLARQADQFALVRALHHTHSLHHPWPMMTGTMQQTTTYGAAVTFLKRGAADELPPYVHLGTKLSVGAGTLGAGFDPLEIRDPTDARASLESLTLARDLSPDRLEGRAALLQDVDRWRRLAESSGAARAQDGLYQRALALLTSARVRDAFDLNREPEAVRDRYGANSFGQSCLLARKLVEAGTRFVQVMWYDREDGFAVGWDVHGDDFNGLVRMEQQLCPRFDQGLSALLEDLRRRGLLDSTLVCAFGEFGRTPGINRHGGRDHWPYCFSALLAGGGVPGGAVVGASDSRGAYPVDRPVTPADFAATLYRLLGVDVTLDDRLRPAIFEGHPVDELCA
jgi:uncharacterized protein (DUF1501 family)